MITARCSNTDLVVAREKPMSAGLVSGLACRCVRSRSAWACRACWVRPEIIHGTMGEGISGPGRLVVLPAGVVASLGVVAFVAGGACSRMMWALVPLMPKEETPAPK